MCFVHACFTTLRSSVLRCHWSLLVPCLHQQQSTTITSSPSYLHYWYKLAINSEMVRCSVVTKMVSLPLCMRSPRSLYSLTVTVTNAHPILQFRLHFITNPLSLRRAILLSVFLPRLASTD